MYQASMTPSTTVNERLTAGIEFGLISIKIVRKVARVVPRDKLIHQTRSCSQKKKHWEDHCGTCLGWEEEGFYVDRFYNFILDLTTIGDDK